MHDCAAELGCLACETAGSLAFPLSEFKSDKCFSGCLELFSGSVIGALLYFAAFETAV